MRNYYLCILLLPLLFITNANVFGQAKVLKSDLSIRPFFKFENIDLQPRIVYDSTDKSFYAISYNGELFHLKKSTDGTLQNQRIATPSDHEINYLQGLALLDGFIYLVGNVVTEQGVSGHGKGVKAKITADGSLKWTTVFQTVEHASSKTLFDHSFSSVCFSPDGKNMFIASGSRTDHGEVKDNEGRYPGLREIPLTSCIYKLPTNTENLVLPNDSAGLAPYIYVRGVRNAFSLAFAPNGDLFSVENSGERDDPEEMNWIRPGAHYGFPWELGGNETPMQFAGYDPKKDKLLNHNYSGYQNGSFHDDKAYPVKPKSLTYHKPIQNLGPDADKYRDPVSGNVMDASDQGKYVTTFTGHRSPLGLVFDTKSTLGGEYTGQGFVLSYQAGSESYGPMEDPSQDLLMVKLKKNDAGDDYVLNAYRIAMDFSEPTDAKIVDNKLYVLEARGQVWEITFPKEVIKEIVTGTEPAKSISVKAYPNPSSGFLAIEWSEKQQSVDISISDVVGRKLLNTTKKATDGRAEMDLTSLHSGIYFLKVQSQSHSVVTKILVNP